MNHFSAYPHPRPHDDATTTFYRVLCTGQGLYYLVTGIWPLVSIETFQMITGPKTDHLVTGLEADHWLVKTVGVLIAVISVVLLMAAWRGQPAPEVALLAVGSAVGLTAIDVIYVARRVIPPIYLMDAVAEVILILAWLAVIARLSRGATRSARTSGAVAS